MFSWPLLCILFSPLWQFLQYAWRGTKKIQTEVAVSYSLQIQESILYFFLL